MLKTRRRTLVFVLVLVCTTFAVLIPRLLAGPSESEIAEMAQARQDDVGAKIEPLLTAYEDELGVSRILWREGPITADCADDSARARWIFHFDVPTTDETYNEVMHDALYNLLLFFFSAPFDIRATIEATTFENASFYQVLEFRLPDYVLTLNVHTGPGEEPDVMVVGVNAYSTCI